MPWVIEGKCVYKKAEGGGKGELIKCHESAEKAKAHMRALYANVHEGLAEFSMSIVKATLKNGEMRFRSVNSDTDKDFYDESMSTELFRDMIDRIENNTPFPEQFKSVICEDDWCGGMPYTSLAHFKSGKGMVNVPAEVLSVYLDGTKLKSTGKFFDTPLGRSVYRSIEKDLEQKTVDNKIRISIGFLDLEHSHGDKFIFTRKAIGQKCPLCSEGVGDKIYRKGVLVHLAFTRIPANPRTDVEVEKSMTTKLEDAKSLVDDPAVLEDLELKSTAAEVEEVLVVKNADDPDEDADEGKSGKGKKKKDMQDMHDEMHKSEAVADIPVAPVAVPVAVPVSPSEILSDFENAIEALKSKVFMLKSSGAVGDAALQELQSSFDTLGAVVKSEFTKPQTPEEIVKSNMESTLRSLLQEMLPQMLPQAITQAVAPIQQELGELRALSTASPVQTQKVEQVPQPRSLSLNLTQRSAVEQITQKSSSWSQLANRSVGLPENFVR